MISADVIANKIGDVLEKELKLDKEKKGVVIYGTFAIIQIILAIFLTALFGWVFGVLVESLIISFCITFLRKYSGGAHAKTPNKCLVIGVIICVLPAYIIKNYIKIYNYNIQALFVVIIFSLIFYLVYIKAPVDSPGKRITNLKKRQRLKKRSLLVVGIYFSAVCLLFVIFINTLNIEFIVYIGCICFGGLWQAFTLLETAELIFWNK